MCYYKKMLWWEIIWKRCTTKGLLENTHKGLEHFEIWMKTDLIFIIFSAIDYAEPLQITIKQNAVSSLGEWCACFSFSLMRSGFDKMKLFLVIKC